MKTILALLLMTAIGHCGIIYEVNNYPSHQAGHTITGFWELDLEPIDPNSFSLPVTAADVVAWGFEIDGTVPGAFNSGSTNATIFTPEGLTATDTELFFDQQGVGNNFLYVRARDSNDLFESIVWVTNDVQDTFGYDSRHGIFDGSNPTGNARFFDVVPTGHVVAGINPIVTTEPRNLGSLLFIGLALFGVMRKRLL